MFGTMGDNFIIRKVHQSCRSGNSMMTFWAVTRILSDGHYGWWLNWPTQHFGWDNFLWRHVSLCCTDMVWWPDWLMGMGLDHLVSVYYGTSWWHLRKNVSQINKRHHFTNSATHFFEDINSSMFFLSLFHRRLQPVDSISIRCRLMQRQLYTLKRYTWDST